MLLTSHQVTQHGCHGPRHHNCIPGEKSKSEKPFRETSAFYPRRKNLEISAYIYFIDQPEKQKSSKVKEKGLLLNQGAQLDNGF